MFDKHQNMRIGESSNAVDDRGKTLGSLSSVFENLETLETLDINCRNIGFFDDANTEGNLAILNFNF